MFKNHPKGLFVLFFSNMGERFGFYTMFAILTMFLQDHFGWDESRASIVYGWFIMASYATPVIGGIVADTLLGYGKTIISGLIIMITGYFMLAQPVGASPLPVYIGLGVVALGIGLFKGNLNVLVGNLYDAPELKKLRDSAFVIFYMGINAGAMFAPYAATAVKSYFLNKSGFVYDPAIPSIAHKILDGSSISNQSQEYLSNFAGTTNLSEFSTTYLKALSTGYHWAFALAAIAMGISLLVFILFRKYYKVADYKHKDKILAGSAVELTPAETKKRMLALGLVFLIVVFFWMAFHQNGSTLTFFARTYTNLSAGNITGLFFTVPAIISIFLFVIGITTAFDKKKSASWKYGATFLSLVSIVFLYVLYLRQPVVSTIDPSLFQSFNPIFIVLLGPAVIWFFGWLNKRGLEPSTPAKIGLGMFITAAAYSILIFPSLGMPKAIDLSGSVVDTALAASPYWLISNYLSITIAELCLSPMGLSFVSKVSPPKYRGIMQAGWYVATAVGNFLAGYIGVYYYHADLWKFFFLLTLLSIASGIVMFALLKTINKASSQES
jgi:proton-dependent oligopeptide transporter, POT family